MKQFGGVRPIVEIERNLKGYGFIKDTYSYDQGGDFIDFLFGEINGKDIPQLLIDPFSGRFLARVEGFPLTVTHTSGGLDSEPWYSALLDAIYVPITQPEVV